MGLSLPKKPGGSLGLSEFKRLVESHTITEFYEWSGIDYEGLKNRPVQMLSQGMR